MELEKQNAAVNEEPEAALTQEAKEGDKRRRRRPVQSRAPRQEKAPQEEKQAARPSRRRPSAKSQAEREGSAPGQIKGVGVLYACAQSLKRPQKRSRGRKREAENHPLRRLRADRHEHYGL